MEEAFLSRENRQYLLQAIAGQVQVPVDLNRVGAVLENQMGLIRSKMDFSTVSREKGREVISILNKGVIGATVNSLNKGGQVKSFDDAVKERTRMDQSMGMRVRGSASGGVPPSQIMGGLESAGYSIQEAFSEPMTMKEQPPQLESFQQRMERLTREREVDFKPQPQTPPPPEAPAPAHASNASIPQSMPQPQYQPPSPPPPPIQQQDLSLSLTQRLNSKIGEMQFHQILIDTESLGVANEKINDYIFRLNRPLEGVIRMQVLHVSLPRLMHTIPSWASLDVVNDSSSKQITIPFRPGSYSTLKSLVDRCLVERHVFELECDEEGEDPEKLVFHNTSDFPLRIPLSWTWRRLGFHRETTVLAHSKAVADHDIDLRPVDLVSLVIPNLSDEEVCRLHANGVFTPVDIHLPRPIVLSELQIRWKGLHGNIIDFRGLHHTIELRVFTA